MFARSTPLFVALALTLPSVSCAPEPCTVADNGDGTYTLSCPDGTSATIRDGVDGEDGTSWLIDTELVDPGDDCPAGGISVSIGPDVDANGTLSPDEAIDTTFICNGEDGEDGLDGIDGTSWIVRVDPEAAGENCANGGAAVKVGPDENEDGQLNDDEVESTEYICHGANGIDGIDGIDGKSYLVRVDEEAAGTNCADGGLAVHTGEDKNSNGSLDDPEITATEYVCNGADGEDGGGGPSARIEFPTTSSTLYNGSSTTTLGSGGSGVIYRSGSYVQQSYTRTGIKTAKGLSYAFVMDNQTNNSCTVGTLPFDIKVNGTKVGSYSFAGGLPREVKAITGEIDFTGVDGTGTSGDTYVIRFEATTTVCGGGGSYNWFPGGNVLIRP